MKNKLLFTSFGKVSFAIVCLFLSLAAKGQLNGKYTIDSLKPASSTNYQTFNSAIADLEAGVRLDGGTPNGSGVSGPVVFNVANAIYHEQMMIPYIRGTSDTNNITFQSASGDSSKVVLLNTEGFGLAVIGLDSASYISFKKISIINYYTYIPTIYLYKGISDSFVNCVITQHSTENDIGCISENDGVGNVFLNNYITGGNGGFDVRGDISFYENRLKILNNEIDSSRDIAIQLFYVHTFQISGNKITNVVPGTYVTPLEAIDIRAIDSSWEISGNQINITGDMGLALYTIGKGTGLVANNMIAINKIIRGGNTGGGGMVVTGNYMNFYNNNIYVHGVYDVETYGALTFYRCHYLNFMNNNIVNTDGGY